MPAAATDLLQEVGINTATTLDAPGYTIGGTSVTVASTSNMPTATGITFAMDEVDANGDQVAGSYNEYVGTVASATSITNVSHQNGTDRNYSAGTTTRVYIPVSAERENRIVEWGVTEHTQLGAHAPAIITSRTEDTSPATGDLVLTSDVSASNALKKVTISNLKKVTVADSVKQADLDTGAGGIGAAWQSWTPTLSGRFDDADWTKTAKYVQIGKTVHYRMTLVATAAAPMDGGTADCIFTLPVASVALPGTADKLNIGTGTLFDATGATYHTAVVLSSTTTARLKLYVTDATNSAQNVITSTTPFTWTTSDEVNVSGTYEVA